MRFEGRLKGEEVVKGSKAGKSEGAGRLTPVVVVEIVEGAALAVLSESSIERTIVSSDADDCVRGCVRLSNVKRPRASESRCVLTREGA